MEYGIFIFNVQVLMAILIAIKTIVQFATTFERVYRTSNKVSSYRSMNIERSGRWKVLMEIKNTKG